MVFLKTAQAISATSREPRPDKMRDSKSMIILATELTENGGITDKAAGELTPTNIWASKLLQEGVFVT